MVESMNVNKDINNSLTNLLLSSSQPNTSIENSSEINTDTPSRPMRSKKSWSPESPDDLSGIARQIKRRNSLGDLNSTTSKKLRESIGNSLSKTVEEQVNSDLDEHIKTLRKTIKKNKKQ